VIIHSVEYYQALKSEMLSLERLLNSKPYVSDIPFVTHGVKNEIAVCDAALRSVKCNHCFHNMKNENRCAVNGDFPPSLDKNSYKCPNWVFDDIPF